MRYNLVFLCLLILTVGCGPKMNLGLKEKYLSSASVVEESTQEVLDSLIDDIDEAGGEDFSQGEELTYESLPDEVIEQSFNEAPELSEDDEQKLCRRAVKVECNENKQQRTFDYCKLRKFELAGNVTLIHDSSESCEASYEAGRVVLSEVGDSVTRDVSIQRIGPSGGILTASGYASFEKISSGYKINKDKIRILSIKGQEKFNYRLVATDLEVNKLKRVGRKIKSGNITVTHNLASFTSSHTFNDLSWDTACCYPSSGSIDIELTGSKERSRSLSFSNICGLVSVNFGDGQSSEIKLKNCKM